MTYRLLIILLIFISCNSNERNNQKEKVIEESVIYEETRIKDSSILNNIDKEKYSERIAENSISIIGDDIWVRDHPAKGEVIMKLNDGDRCILLDTGQFQVISGLHDYWYKISFEGQEGWVFGSQTSIKNENKLKDHIDELLSNLSIKIDHVKGNPCFVEIIEKNKKNYLLYFDCQEGDYSEVSFVSINSLGALNDKITYSGVFEWKKDHKKYEFDSEDLICVDVGDWVIENEVQILKTKRFCIKLNQDGSLTEK